MRALAIQQGIWSTVLQVARVSAGSLLLARVLAIEAIGGPSPERN